MKLAVSSDWHPDWKTHGVDRFEEVEKAVNYTIDKAIEEEVDGYAFLGDLCDPDAGSVVFRCVELMLKSACRLSRAGIPNFWMPGNHDVIEDGSGDTTLSPMRALCDVENSIVFLAEKPGLYQCFSGLDVLALPYTPTSHNYDPAKVVVEAFGEGRPFIAAGHLMVPGCVPGEETTEMPRGRDVMFPLDSFADKNGVLRPLCKLKLNGHYHRRQFTSGVHIPGSLAMLTFGEEGNYPGFLLIEVP